MASRSCRITVPIRLAIVILFLTRPSGGRCWFMGRSHMSAPQPKHQQLEGALARPGSLESSLQARREGYFPVHDPIQPSMRPVGSRAPG